jgi:hypothetical protein
MKKVIVIAAIFIIVIGILGIFAFYQYDKYYQDKLSKTSPVTQTKTKPTTVTTKLPENVAVSPTLQAIVGTQEPMNLEFQMIDAVILPQFRSVFILNIINNQENVCQEGGFLHSKEYGRWTIFSIRQDETIIRQYYNDGSVAKEHTLQRTPKSNTPNTATVFKIEPSLVHAYRPGEKQPGPFKEIDKDVDFSSPESIDKALAQTPANEVLGIVRTIPDSVVESVLKALPQDYLKQKIQESPVGMAVTEETYKNHTPAEVINILRKAADDYTPKGENMLVFSTQVNASPDNSPISPTALFNTGLKKIYACFENKGPLAKLDRVIIKWTNVTTQKVVYWSAFMLNSEAAYNYIFVKPEARWEAGKYLITIYKQVQSPDPVAYGEFEVK